MTRHLGSQAAIAWTDSAETASERVHLLAVPLRALSPGFAQNVYRGESLDKSTIESFTVTTGAHELIGELQYDDDPQSAMDMLRAGNANLTLTYYPSLTDPDVSYACKLVEPTGMQLATALDPQRGSFGNLRIPIRLRRTDQSSFQPLYVGTNVLYMYRGGQSLAGYTFTRATATTAIGKGRGQLGSVSSGIATTEWWDTDGDGLRDHPALRTSPARTNLCLQSENFGTTWTTTGSPTRSAGALTCGTLSLDLLGDDSAAALEGYLQTVTFTGDAVKAVSVFCAQGTSTTSLIQLRDGTASANRLFAVVTWSSGVPSVSASTGTHLGTVKLDKGVFRLLFQTTSVTAANTNSLQVYPACDAGASAALTGDLYVGGVQCEDALYPGPYIPTTTGTVTRNADVLTTTVNARVEPMTWYVRFIELGARYDTSLRRILELSSGNPRIALQWAAGGFYQFFWTNAAGSSVTSSAAAASHSIGATVELVGILNTDGSVQLIQAVNGVAVTSAASSAQTLPFGPWGNTTLGLGNSGGGSSQFSGAILNACILRGALSASVALDTMRRVARV